MPHYCVRTHLHGHYRDHDSPGAGGVNRTTRAAGAPPVRSAPAAPSHDEIAALAHSYWEARGRQGGSPLEDWFRAERELRRKP